MKCKNCGSANPEGSTHCTKCHTMLRYKDQNKDSGGTRALIQILLLVLGMIGVVALLWFIMHDLLHTV